MEEPALMVHHSSKSSRLIPSLPPILGRSLLDLPERGSDDDKIFIEFNGEGLYAPAMIIVKGNLKLVHSRTDPKMLFDLAKDPLELTNLADNPAYQDDLEAMFAEMQER